MLAFTAAAVAAQAEPAPSNCSPALTQAVGRHFGLPEFRLPGEDSAANIDGAAGRLIAAQCRPWTAARGQTVAAFVYQGNDADASPLLLALVGHKGTRVLASYRTALAIDGATELSRDSAQLDAEAWALAPGGPGIGLRIRKFRDRCQFEGGLDHELRLFQQVGSRLRPVLRLPTEHWRWGPGNHCLNEDVPRISARVQVAVHPGQRSGQSTLTLTASRSDGVPPLHMQLRHDGHPVDLAAWDQAFSRWFDR